MIILYTNKQVGHYKNYIEIIKTGAKHQNVISCFQYKSLFKMCKVDEMTSVIFLNGDQDFLKAFWLKCFFWRHNISLIIYYSFQNTEKTLFQFIKAATLKFITYLNLKFFLLESEPFNVKYANQNNLIKLYDPILSKVNNNKFVKSSTNKNSITYLVAGYLDERKSIPELFSALECLSKHDKKRRKIILLGIQDKSINNFINSLETVIEFEVRNYRYSEDEFVKMISISDIVWAVYKGHYGSSSMVISAVQHNKKIIFLPFGVLRLFAIELDLEKLPLKDDINSLVESLVYIERKQVFSQITRNLFLSKRSPENFINILLGCNNLNKKI